MFMKQNSNLPFKTQSAEGQPLFEDPQLTA
uniref:Uncharacterized protein n=1 Tax=Anguilla anguilla TaxID=7936 RepID=A0A0E9S2B4_ANGAN